MHDKVYNRRGALATPLPPLALEMDTQDARVTFIPSISKLKLLKFDARSLYFKAERASYFAKLNLVSTEFFAHILSNCIQVLFLSTPCEMVHGEGFSA